MIQPGGFVDLRPTSGNRAAEDSVWPSFTDIMTVIVMIFLMALVVILIRNVDLVRQLRETITLEQESAAQSDTLELRVATLADEIASLQLRLGESDALRTQAESTADEREQKVRELLGSVAALQQIREELAAENVGLVSSRNALQGQLLSSEEKQRLLEEVGRGLENDIAMLASQRDSLLEDKLALTEKNTFLAKEYREETAALTQLNLTLEQEAAELVTLKAVLDQRVKDLEKAKLLLESDQAALSETNASLNRRVSALTQFQLKLESQVDDLGVTIATLEAEKERLFEENRSTTAWLATLLELRRSLEADKESLTVSLAESEQSRGKLEARRLNLEQEVSELIEARLTLEQEKAALIDQAGELQNESRRQEDSLRSQINLMASNKGLLEKEKTELEQKIDTLIQQQKDDTKERAALSTRLSGSEERYRLTKKELDYLVSKHAAEITEFEKEKTLLIENLQAFDLLKSLIL